MERKSKNYKITIEYDGTGYLGWADSIDKTVESAIAKLTKEEVKIFGAGRTDAGVHALGQVANFYLTKEFEAEKIPCGLNHFLKEVDASIRIVNCVEVSSDFHARFSAVKRYYRYRILNRPHPSILDQNRVWHLHAKLNFDEMLKTLPLLVGKKDWSCFMSSVCVSNPIKTIDKVNLFRNNEEIIFEIEAKSFLHHQVRTIMGTIVEVGLGRFTVNDFENIILSKDRTKAGRNAPPYGLYLVKVDY
ncbi:MAG: tRNA pseudouridine(38-40) synthase TruA [Rickettsiales bacterium]|nr:tRNA pseudouridine(38-40) synthase TruA [Rickettsiales bacterium]